MQIVIPMVGLGKRFSDAGYSQPKPLIPVDGQPMIVRVVQDLPSASKIVFVINSQHVKDFQIDRVLLDYFPHGEIVVSNGLTAGQACSVELGCERLDPDDSVLVAACDNTHLIDEATFANVTNEGGADALIWTYSGEPRVITNPQWYGWVQCDAQYRVTNVSVKKPLSQNLLADQVVSGTFWFRRAADLSAGIAQLISRNIRVNNEFYLDSVPQLLMERGLDVRCFPVEKYIGWGTPADYEDYLLWSRYVQRSLCSSAA